MEKMGARASAELAERAEQGEGAEAVADLIDRLAQVEGLAGVHLMPLGLAAGADPRPGVARPPAFGVQPRAAEPA